MSDCGVVTRVLIAAGFALSIWASIWASAGLAALDLEAADPAERGASTALALVARFSPRPGGTAAVYGFKPFGLAEIDFAAVAVTVSAGRFPEGAVISYERLGAPSYAEQTWGLALGSGFGPVTVEPRLRVAGISAAGGFDDWAVLVDLAARSRISRSLRVAAALENPLSLGLVRAKGSVPQRVRVGLGVLAADGLGFGFEMVKEPRFAASFRSGVEWRAAGCFVVRSGVRTSPAVVSFGIGLAWKAVTLDWAVACDFELGVTYEAGLTVAWK